MKNMKNLIRRLTKDKSNFLLLFVLIFVLAIAVFLFSDHQRRAPSREVAFELASVAEGIGVPDVASFNPANPGTHRLVILPNG